ncbi:MAG: hypothetical protein KGL52_03330 [Rhodospirillales bacterium]|nr:hypothetical protein [Rhodospirillales bacterium]
MTGLGCLLPFVLTIGGAFVGAAAGGRNGGMAGLAIGAALGLGAAAALFWGMLQIKRRR